MADKHDLRRIALALDGVMEKGESFSFSRDGRGMIWPYLEKVHPKKARVARYDQFVMRVAGMDDKLACLEGDSNRFFTTPHYDGYASVIVRLDTLDEEQLRDIVQDAWEATPLSTRLPEKV